MTYNRVIVEAMPGIGLLSSELQVREEAEEAAVQKRTAKRYSQQDAIMYR
jgi:hypothetical protein